MAQAEGAYGATGSVNNVDVLKNSSYYGGGITAPSSSKEAALKELSRQFAEAQKNNDWVTMTSVNKKANALRGLGSIVTAQNAIQAAKVAEQNSMATGRPVEPATLTNRVVSTNQDGSVYYTNRDSIHDNSRDFGQPTQSGGTNTGGSGGAYDGPTNAGVIGDAAYDGPREERRERREPRRERSSERGYDYDLPNIRDYDFPDRPELRSAQSMADLMGINYDYDYINGIFTDAVDKKYNNLDNEFRRSQDTYYDMVGQTAKQMVGTMRRGDREAVMTGINRGAQAAAEVGAVSEVALANAQGATDVVQQRDDLVRNRETDMAQVTQDALKHYNDLGISLGTLSNSELNALVTAYASEYATVGGIYNTDTLAAVEKGGQANQRYIEDNRIASQEAIEAARNKATLESSRISAAANRSYSGGSYSGGSSSSGGSPEDLQFTKEFVANDAVLKNADPDSREYKAALDWMIKFGGLKLPKETPILPPTGQQNNWWQNLLKGDPGNGWTPDYTMQRDR